MLPYGHLHVDFGDIYTYLVDTPGKFTREWMMGLTRVWMLLINTPDIITMDSIVSIFKAFLFNCSGWVKTVLAPNVFSKAVVRALQSVKTEHKAWVSVLLLRRQEHSSLVIVPVWQGKYISQN